MEEKANDYEMDPEYIDEEGYTSLMIAIVKGNKKRAFDLISSGKANTEKVNDHGYTALMMACIYKFNDIALAIIETGKSNPEHVEKGSNQTALMYACQYKMPDVALALIATRNSNPSQVNTTNQTALMYTCQYKMTDVALALIATGESNPSQVSEEGNNTALMYACHNKMTDVALALISTGESNPEQKNNRGLTALDYAKKRGLEEVVRELNKLRMFQFNIQTTAIDIIDGKYKSLKDLIEEENIIFVFYDEKLRNSQNVAISYERLKQTFIQDKNSYIVYECKKLDSIDPNFLHMDHPYFDIKKLCGFGDVIPLLEMDMIMHNNLNKIFIFKRGKKLLTTVSDDVLNHRTSFVSGRHCQEGQSSYVYNLIKDVIFVCDDGGKTAGGKQSRKQKKTKRRKNKKTKRRKK